MDLPPLATRLAIAAQKHHGRALVVGGGVRDWILGAKPKDIDMEFFGVTPEQIDRIVADCGPNTSVSRVGRSFPVWKVWADGSNQSQAIDVALPRREVRHGNRHTDFDVELEPSMPFAEASARRDFTINALAYDPLSGEVLDAHGGLDDLRRRRLRHVSGHFGEDPLRVLRGAQFCARFGLTPDTDTVRECQRLTPDHIAAERIWGEFEKLLVKGQRPGLGLEFLESTEWLRFFPELKALVGVQQDSEHHPEGDAWVHTRHCVDHLPAVRSGVEEDDRVLGFAVLCHDLGKPETAAIINGRWRAHGHEAAGEAPTRGFLSRMTANSDFVNSVVGLVVNHMRPKFAWKEHCKGHHTDRSVRRLATVTRIDLLANVVRCDNAGRPPRPALAPEADWIERRARELGVERSRPTPLLRGRDLLAAGFTAGPEFGRVLSHVYEMQLDGKVDNIAAAFEAACQHLRHPVPESDPMLSCDHTDHETVRQMGVPPGNTNGPTVER